MAASILPQEMVEAIIDHLHDDKVSLKACSLVCKNWTHPARLHLFSRATVKLPLQPAAFPFVRHLYIRMDVQHGPQPTQNDIIPLLIGFHRIISLEVDLSRCSTYRVCPSAWLALNKNFSGIVSLSLTNFRFGYRQEVIIAQVICGFPCLRKLSFRGVTISALRWVFLPELATFRLPPGLDTLELGTGMQVLLRWFLSFSVRPALRILRLHQVPRGLAILPEFLRAIGNSLESLVLSVQDVYLTALTEHPIDITPLTNLRSIQFELCEGHPVYPIRWVTQVLSQIPSVHVEDLSFQILGGEICSDFSHALEWHRVDAILQHSTFSHLRRVSFPKCVFSLTSDGSQSTCALVQRLPQCAARGILRIDQ